MLTVTNFLRGYLEVKVTGPFPERFLNIAARSGVEFWRLERAEDGSLSVRIRTGKFALLQSLAEKALCEIEVAAERGAPFFARRYAGRYVFLAGLCLCFILVAFVSVHVWDIEVIGNSGVSAERILRNLREVGFGIGVRSSQIDPARLEDLMLLRIKELSWLTVNVTGTRATVEVRERVPAPEILDQKTPCNIVARKSGVIEKINVLEGAGQVSAGDTVNAGDLIASGIVDTAAGLRLVRADAEVVAKTWYTLEAAIPLEYTLKTPTETEKRKYAVVIGGKRINLYFSSSIFGEDCDKIIERMQLSLLGGIVLPVVLETATVRSYEKATGTFDSEYAENILERTLILRLESVSGGAEVVGTDFEFREEGGLLYATLTAECRERIETVAVIPFDMEMFK